VIESAPLHRLFGLLDRESAELAKVVTTLDAEASVAARQKTELRHRLEETKVARGELYNPNAMIRADEFEQALTSILPLHKDLALAEERSRQLGATLSRLHRHQDLIWNLQRSLHDIMATQSQGKNSTNGAGSSTTPTAHNLFQLVEDERMRIARDMHDGPAQSMSNLVLQAEVLERLYTIHPERILDELIVFKNTVRGVLDELRRLIFDLRPMSLDDLGLFAALRKYLTEYRQQSGLDVRFSLLGGERRLPATTEEALFRILQESMANIRKHAGATHVELTLTLSPTKVQALIHDNGKGFDPARPVQDGRRHLGLTSMRERTDLQGGHLELHSKPGQGTTVTVTFALPPS
jgi:two-component system sensor histidine kinase DegS